MLLLAGFFAVALVFFCLGVYLGYARGKIAVTALSQEASVLRKAANDLKG